MQGRLSPPVLGRLQAFPWSSWEEEFTRARECGFDIIEWLFEAERYEQNPIWTESGLNRIRKRIAATGVQVRTLCADYFMAHPFFRVSEHERAQSVAVLTSLITRAATVGVRTILVPVLEASEIRTDAEKVELLSSLSEPLSLAADHGIRLGLETELLADEYRDLIEQGNHAALGVYYDTGNAAAIGYDVITDLVTLNPFLCGVHIKDRRRGGPNVPLGQGDVDFMNVFRVLAKVGYSGPIVLETASGADFLSIASRHLKFVKDRLMRGKSV